MKLRVIAVPVGNVIKKIPNDTWHLFFLLGSKTICRLTFEQGEDVTIRCQSMNPEH